MRHVSVYIRKIRGGITSADVSLSPLERQYLNTIKSDKRLGEYLESRLLIKEIVQQRYQCAHEHVEYRQESKTQKPGLYLNGVQPSGIFHSLSHSEEYIAFGISEKCAIGIDMEKINNDRPVFTIAEKFFSPDETLELRGSIQPYDFFYELWTKHEAMYKAGGFDLAFARKAFRDIPDFSFYTFTENGHKISVCIKQQISAPEVSIIYM